MFADASLHPSSCIVGFALTAQALFENSIMLAGLGGAVVPLVIHLLGRARYRSVEWGAMMFIDPPDNGHRRDPGRLRELTLLLIRMAAVALLAIALARPASSAFTRGATASAGTGNAGEPLVAAAIVVDCSASMSYADVAGTRMEQAQRAALQILSTMRRGDRASIIAAGPGASPAAGAQLSGDLQSVAARASDLKPAAGRSDLPGAIRAAADLLGRQERVSRQLFVITDRQRATWSTVGGEFLDSFRAHAPLARFAVIPVGGDERDNLAVESIALVNQPAVVKCPAQVQVRVRNYGSEPRRGVPLAVRIGFREAWATTINVPAGETITVTATVTFATADPKIIAAELRPAGGGTGPTLDDRREVVIDVWPPLRSLIVRGGGGGGGGGHVATAGGDAGGDDVLLAALAPPAGGAVAAADVTRVDQWDAADLGAYRVIILDDVPTLGAAQLRRLEQFVYAGGGVLIAPGPAAQIAEYNRLMFREDGGLLPALLQPPVTPPAALGIDGGSIDPQHPMTHFLGGSPGPDGALPSGIERYFSTTGRTPAARALANFTSGDAFLIESPYGRGRAVLMTTPLGASWSSLPLTPFYLPLVQSTVRYLAGAPVADRNAASGAELVARFTPEVATPRGAVVRPDRTREPVEVVSEEGRSEARYDRTDLAGVYTFTAGARGERTLPFAVAPPPEESDLAPTDEARWQELEGQLGFTRMEPRGRTIATRLIAARTTVGGEDRFWLAALAGVLALFMLELGLARLWLAGGGAAA